MQKKKKKNDAALGEKQRSERRQTQTENPFDMSAFTAPAAREAPAEEAAEKTAPATKQKKRTEKRAEKRTEKRTKAEKKEARTPRRKRKKVIYDGGISGDFLYVVLMSIAILAAVGFAVTAFFKVSVIEVTGNDRTNAAEIRSVSGIEEGDRMIFLNRFEIRDNIFAQIPYVDEIRIRQLPPNKVVLEVTECEPVAAVSSGGVYYIISDTAKLLEYYPITGPSAYPVITGLEVQTTEPGKTIDLGDELRIVSLKAVVESLATDAELCMEIGEINMEKLYDVSFTYDGRLTVNLGEADELTKKLQLFKEILTKLERTDKGTIGLKNTDSVTFLPESR